MFSEMSGKNKIIIQKLSLFNKSHFEKLIIIMKAEKKLVFSAWADFCQNISVWYRDHSSEGKKDDACIYNVLLFFPEPLDLIQ